jgi:hypothetical protein
VVPLFVVPCDGSAFGDGTTGVSAAAGLGEGTTDDVGATCDVWAAVGVCTAAGVGTTVGVGTIVGACTTVIGACHLSDCVCCRCSAAGGSLGGLDLTGVAGCMIGVGTKAYMGNPFACCCSGFRT